MLRQDAFGILPKRYLEVATWPVRYYSRGSMSLPNLKRRATKLICEHSSSSSKLMSGFEVSDLKRYPVVLVFHNYHYSSNY